MEDIMPGQCPLVGPGFVAGGGVLPSFAVDFVEVVEVFEDDGVSSDYE
jgi:hypothetical protein